MATVSFPACGPICRRWCLNGLKMKDGCLICECNGKCSLFNNTLTYFYNEHRYNEQVVNVYVCSSISSWYKVDVPVACARVRVRIDTY